MLPDNTTTIGASLPDIHISPFQIINADVITIPENHSEHN